MNYRIKEEIFDGILTAALCEYIDEVEKTVPSNEELAKMYPLSKKAGRRYRKIAKAKKHTLPLPIVYLGRTAVIFLAVISIMFGLLITNTNVRAAVADTVVEWYEKYIQIDFSKEIDDSDNSDSTEETVESLKIGYIPSGFELSDATEKENSREYMYIKDDGDYIIIGIYTSDSTDITADIEQMEYEVMTINKNDAYITYNQENRAGVVAIGNNTYTIWITALIDKSELIKVAENIK